MLFGSLWPPFACMEVHYDSCLIWPCLVATKVVNSLAHTLVVTGINQQRRSMWQEVIVACESTSRPFMLKKSTCRFVTKLETPLGEGMFLTYDGIPINHQQAIKCFKQDCKLISNSNKASEEYLIRLALLFMTFQQGIPPQSSIEDIWPPMVWNLMMFISCSNLTQMKQMMNHSLYISSSSISRAIPFPIANPKFQVRMVFIWHKWEVYIPCLLHDFLERYDSSIFPY